MRATIVPSGRTVVTENTPPNRGRCSFDLHVLLNYSRDGGDEGIRIDRLCNVRLEPGG